MDYGNFRYGSAGAATPSDLKRAGIIDGRGVSFGFDETKHHELRVPTDGSVALFGGSGSGKSASAFANALIGGHLPGSFICFSPRGELEAISMLSLSAYQNYELYFINPIGMLGLPQHRLNPLDHLVIDNNPSLIADTQKMAQDFCPTPTGAKSSWPYDDARRWLTELSLYDSERSGCASLPGIFELLMTMQGDHQQWCDHLERMLESRFESVRSFVGEIMALQQGNRESYTAPLGVFQRTLEFLRDQRLQATLSGNDFSLQWLTDSTRRIGVFVTWPIEYIQIHAPVIRQILGAAIQNKFRSPGSAPVSVLIDECGLLGNMASARELMIFGRGAGLVSNMLAWQEISQIRAAFGSQADEIIGSAQFRVFKGVRTMASAQLVSQMAGTMTLDFDDDQDQSNARRLKEHAAQQLISGGDFLSAVTDLRHYKAEQSRQSKKARLVLTPDEVLNLPPSAMVAFASGLVEGPIMGHWINHYERPDFAGRYLNNPYHSELVEIRTRWGMNQVRVIEEPVPKALEHLPQYQGGTWRYPKGHRPKL